MPKQVDHAERRQEIAAALWRIVTTDGIEAASIRRVAAEAGWSAGSVRHYFETQGQLLAFALELVSERVAARIALLPAEDDPRRRAGSLLRELLPLDAERRTEMRVWWAFTTRALVDPALEPLRHRAHDDLRQLCLQAADALGAAGVALAGERLHALVDGLALHGLLAPDVTTPERQGALLDAHLAQVGA